MFNSKNENQKPATDSTVIVVEVKKDQLNVETISEGNGVYFAHVSPNAKVSPYSSNPVDRIKVAYDRFEKALAGKL